MTPLPARLKLPPDGLSNLTETIILPDAAIQAAWQMPRHPIGLNVRQDVDFAKLLAFVKQQGGLRALLLHVDTGALPRARDFVPHVSALVWRNRAFNHDKLRIEAPHPEQWMDAQIDAITAVGLSLEQVWVHLHNESGWSPELIEWERRAALRAVSRGARVVCLNCAVGTPEPGQFALAKPLLELAGNHPDQVMIGLHEYFSVYGWRKERWYLARWKEWEVYRTGQKIKPVRYLITEFGTEDIADDHPYTQTLPRQPGKAFVGPVHANDAAWAATYNSSHNSSPKPYPGKDAAYYEQIETAYSIGRYAENCIEAVLLFSWGSDGGRWTEYDIQHMSVLHGLLAGWDKREKEPIVITPPPVEEAEWIPATLINVPAGVRVRAARSTTAAQVASIVNNSPCAYKLDPAKSGSYWWLPVKNQHDVEGYAALLFAPLTATPDTLQPFIDQQFQRVVNDPAPPPEPVPDPEPPPAPEPEPDPDDTAESPAVQYVTVQEARDMVDAAKEATMSYMKEWTLALLTELVRADSHAALAKIDLLNKPDLPKAS